MKKRWKIIIFVALLGIVIYHSFYFEDLEARKSALAKQEFNATEYVRNFWQKLLNKRDGAPEAAEIYTLLNRDIPAAIKNYSTKSNDVSSTHFFLLRGQGKAVSITEDGVRLSLDKTKEESQIFIATDLIFGNAVRNASGLVNSDQFDSMDYNHVSEAINAKVMNEVIPTFRDQVQEQSTVLFFGAGQVFESDPQIRPWKIIPIYLEVK